MSWRGPSLTKRLLFGSMLSLVGLTLLLLAFVLAITPRRYMATEYGVMVLHDDVRRSSEGELVLRRNAKILDLAERSPGLWFIASDGETRIVHGAPPADALTLFPIVERSLEPIEAGMNLRIGPDLETGHASIEETKTSAGEVTAMVGGLTPAAAGPAIFGFNIFAALLTMLIPVVVVIGMVVLLIIRPIVLKGLRPLSAAAAGLDGGDLDKRLPERGVMTELLPLVRALNSALDRLQAAFEARRRFMADLAHEFRTPLAVLTMHADELPESSTKADLQRGLFRMSQMVGQMLDSERLGRPGHHREPVDLVVIAKSAVADTAPLALEAGYELEFAAARESIVVTGDPHAIKRAVTNLLANAVAHAGGAGAIRVRVTADAAVEVSDEGPGLPVEARERVFEPFHRERWDKDGCGLGLHLVRQVMQAHGGRAEVAGDAPGALFRLVFPAPPAAGLAA